MPRQDMESERGAALIRIGRVGIVGGDEQALDDFFNQKDYRFHGPDGDLDYPTLKAFLAMLRSALSDFTCERDDLIVKGDMVAARTHMSGRFTGPFESGAYGRIQPNGRYVELEMVNFFKFDDNGKLVEEWVAYDNLGWYRQLGVDLIPNAVSNGERGAQ